VDVRRLEDPGFDVESPTGAGWRLPDGAEKLDWELSHGVGFVLLRRNRNKSRARADVMG
jgi:hypothetical protein